MYSTTSRSAVGLKKKSWLHTIYVLLQDFCKERGFETRDRGTVASRNLIYAGSKTWVRRQKGDSQNKTGYALENVLIKVRVLGFCTTLRRMLTSPSRTVTYFPTRACFAVTMTLATPRNTPVRHDVCGSDQNAQRKTHEKVVLRSALGLCCIPILAKRTSRSWDANGCTSADKNLQTR